MKEKPKNAKAEMLNQELNFKEEKQNGKI